MRDPDPGAHEAGYLKLDSSKARAELKWRPKLSIERALEWTADWYRSSKQGEEMQAFSQHQISSYESL